MQPNLHLPGRGHRDELDIAPVLLDGGTDELEDLGDPPDHIGRRGIDPACRDDGAELVQGVVSWLLLGL